MELTARSAVVTGGASGLGAATALALLERGATVHVIDQADPGDGRSDSITYFEADVTSEDAVAAVFAEVACSDAPLGLVVNCAGVAPAIRIVKDGTPHALDAYRRVVEINLVGTFNVLARGAAVMTSSPANEDGVRGVVINTASIAAYEGQIGQAAYASSKGGVVALTLAAARDLSAVGIRVCTIAPGTMDTPMLAGMSTEVRARLEAGVPLPARLCRPEEFARLVLSVVDHDYLNGEVIRMDGALRMAPR